MEKGDLCLVTGITGYLASWIAKYLLDEGYRVRGTVRSLKDTSRIKTIRALLPEAELIEADLKGIADWQKAVEGCKWIFHVASPSAAKSERNRTDTNLNGTSQLLDAALQCAAARKVVLTSSEAAIVCGHPPTKHKFSEDDWSVTTGIGDYYRSKTLTEKLAWDRIRDTSRNPNGVALSTMNPGMLFGPALVPWSRHTLDVLRDIATGKIPMLPDLTVGVVDVRDCARMHIAVMKSASTTGNRHLAIAASGKFVEVAAAIREGYAHHGFSPSGRIAPRFALWFMRFFDEDVATFYPRLGQDTVYNTKYPDVYSYQHRTIREIVRDSIDSLIQNGSLKAR